MPLCSAKMGGLFDGSDDLVGLYINHLRFGNKTGADKSILSIRTKNRHAGAVPNRDSLFFLVSLAVDYRYVIFAANGHPDFSVIRQNGFRFYSLPLQISFATLPREEVRVTNLSRAPTDWASP